MKKTPSDFISTRADTQHDLESEDMEDEYSIPRIRNLPKADYLTTNLLWKKNMTLADIKLE